MLARVAEHLAHDARRLADVLIDGRGEDDLEEVRIRARSVFPVPGERYKGTPFVGLIPIWAKSSGFRRGSSMTYLFVTIL